MIGSCDIGKSSYISENSSLQCVKVGSFCAIGSNVKICIGNHPVNSFVSIHPCFYSTCGQGTPSFVDFDIYPGHKYTDDRNKYVVEIGNDVWIGNDVSVLDGIRIGDGAIIGIGSVVTKDVEPYTIVAGIPAKVIRKRFTEKEVLFLSKFKWWDKSDEWIKEHSCYFNNISSFILKNEQTRS